MLAVDGAGEVEGFEIGEREGAGDVAEEPPGRDGARIERLHVAHRGAPADDGGAEVAVAAGAFRGVAAPGVAVGGVAPAEAAAVEDERTVRDDVLPRDALGVGVFPGGHPRGGGEVVGLAGVEVPDEGVVAGFGDRDGPAAEEAAVFVEGLAPGGGGFGAGVESAGAVVPVPRGEVREDVEEDAVGREGVAQRGGVGAERGQEGRRRPAVALRHLAAVEPRLVRGAVGVEDDGVVGEAGGVGVVVDVVVVRGEEHPEALGGGGHVEEALHRATGGPDFRQAVVEAPALPPVADEHGVRDAVFGGLFKAGDRLGVSAAPLVEAHARGGLAPGGAARMAGDVAEGARRGERAARGGHERERRVMAGFDREDVRFAPADHAVGVDVDRLAERGAAVVVGAGVAGEVAEVAGGKRKRARVFEDVPEAQVGAGGGERGGAEAEAREARRAAVVADGAGHVPADAQRGAVGAERGAGADGAAVAEVDAVRDDDVSVVAQNLAARAAGVEGAGADEDVVDGAGEAREGKRARAVGEGERAVEEPRWAGHEGGGPGLAADGKGKAPALLAQ